MAHHPQNSQLIRVGRLKSLAPSKAILISSGSGALSGKCPSTNLPAAKRFYQLHPTMLSDSVEDLCATALIINSCPEAAVV